MHAVPARSLIRVVQLSALGLVTLTSLVAVQALVNPVPAAQTPASSPPPISPVPDAAASSTPSRAPGEAEATVDLPSAPQLPLPNGAVQFFIAPADLDLSKFTFIYATMPGSVDSAARALEPLLRSAGWSVRPGPRSSLDSQVFVVTTPDGSAFGQLDILAMPPGVAGNPVQVVGKLELSDAGKGPSRGSQ